MITIYMLALGVVVPFSGWLGDKLGYKRLYIISMGVFVVGSLLCGLSWSLNSLIVARVIQAIGGGMIMPTTMAMIYRMVPATTRSAAAWVSSASPSSSPPPSARPSGGYLVEYVDWRWIFTINLPIGAVGHPPVDLHPARVPVQASREARHRRGVELGDDAVLPPAGPEQRGRSGAGSTRGRSSSSRSRFFSLVLFIYLELTSENPLLELRVFKYLSFTMANLLVVVTTVGMYAGLFYLPLFLQSFRGLGAMETGLLMMPGALVSGLMMPVTGKLFDKIGPRPLALFGVVLLMFLT